MRERLKTFKRLTDIYAVVEEIHSVEAQRASADVAEVLSVLHTESLCAQKTREGGREALLIGDNAGWSLAVMQEEAAGPKRSRLELILAEREKRREEAYERQRESRLASERMKSLVKDASRLLTIDEERRAQASEDDRFLARRQSR